MAMYQMVHDILNEHQPIWESTPKFVETFGTFTAKFETFKIHAEKQRSYVIGVTDTRDASLKITARMAVRVAAALTSLGEDQNNLSLIQLMRISESKLLNSSHTDAILLLDRIVIEAQDHAEELAEYGIGSELLSELYERRDDLAVSIISPKKAVIKRRDSSSTIAELRKDLDIILKNQLDKLVTVLRPVSESFYVQYMGARRVYSYSRNAASNGSESTNTDEGL